MGRDDWIIVALCILEEMIYRWYQMNGWEVQDPDSEKGRNKVGWGSDGFKLVGIDERYQWNLFHTFLFLFVIYRGFLHIPPSATTPNHPFVRTRDTASPPILCLCRHLRAIWVRTRFRLLSAISLLNTYSNWYHATRQESSSYHNNSKTTH